MLAHMGTGGQARAFTDSQHVLGMFTGQPLPSDNGASKCFEIRMAIPAVQAGQLQQQHRDHRPGWAMLAQPLSSEMGHIKVLDKTPQQNSPR